MYRRAKFWYSNSASGTCSCVLTLVYILSHTKVVRLATFSFSQAKVCTVGWVHQCCQHWCRKQYLRRSQISRYHTSHHYTQAIPLVSSSHIGICRVYCILQLRTTVIYWWRNHGSIPSRGTKFFLLRSVYNGSGAHPSFYSVGSMRSFPCSKATWA